MLNLTLNFQTQEEKFVTMNSFHNALKGFQPYANGDIGICEMYADKDPRNTCFVLSIGEKNDNDKNFLIESGYHWTSNYDLLSDITMVESTFDNGIKRILGASKFANAMAINTHEYFIDRINNIGICVLDIFPDLINNIDSEVYTKLMKRFPIQKLREKNLNEMVDITEFLAWPNMYSFFNGKKKWINGKKGYSDNMIEEMSIQTLGYHFNLSGKENNNFIDNMAKILDVMLAEQEFLTALHICGLI